MVSRALALTLYLLGVSLPVGAAETPMSSGHEQKKAESRFERSKKPRAAKPANPPELDHGSVKEMLAIGKYYKLLSQLVKVRPNDVLIGKIRPHGDYSHFDGILKCAESLSLIDLEILSNELRHSAGDTNLNKFLADKPSRLFERCPKPIPADSEGLPLNKPQGRLEPGSYDGQWVLGSGATLLGVGMVGIIAGIVTQARANSLANSEVACEKPPKETCAEYTELMSEWQATRSTSRGLYLGGGVAAAVGLAVLAIALESDSSPTHAGNSVGLVPLGGGGFVCYSARF